MYHCCRLCLVRCAHYFPKPLHVKWDPFYYLVRRLSMYFIFSVKKILQMHHMTIFCHCLNDRCFHQVFSTFSSLLKSLMDVFFTSNCSNINYFRAFFSVIWYCLYLQLFITQLDGLSFSVDVSEAIVAVGWFSVEAISSYKIFQKNSLIRVK